MSRLFNLMTTHLNLPPLIAADSGWTAFIAQLNAAVSAKKKIPVSGSIPLFSSPCDRCESAPAVLYCPQDKAHFCTACDLAHHASSKLLLKHIRKPVYHSPYQFGFCSTHNSEKIESACLTCGSLLCSVCVLTGSHAAHPDHDLVSTVDAFRLSTSAEGDAAVVAARDKLTTQLKERHRQLHAIQANANEVQEALDKQLRLVTESAEAFGNAKLSILHASKRETLLRLLRLEWAESFFVHMRLSLPAASWLRSAGRWGSEATKFWFLAQSASSTPKLPGWLDTPIVISGALEVLTSDLILPERLADAGRVEWSLEPAKEEPFQPGEVSDIVFALPRSDKLKAKSLPREAATVSNETHAIGKAENVAKFVKASIAALNEGQNVLAFLPEPTTYSRPVKNSSMKLSGGTHPFENALELIKSATSSDRANLIKSCIQVFPAGDNEAFVKVLVEESVKNVALPALAVSPPSLIVSLASAVCPSGDFLRFSCASVLTKPARSDEDALDIARTLIRAVTMENADLPLHVKFVLRTVADAVTLKFGASAGATAATCLFVARFISPTLIRIATSDQNAVPPSISLVCKQLQRIGHAEDSSRDDDIRAAMFTMRSFITDQMQRAEDASLVEFDRSGDREVSAVIVEEYIKKYGEYLEV